MDIQNWIGVIGKIIVYILLAYFIYILLNQLSGKKKKPSKYLFIGFAIVFSLVGILCLIALIYAFIIGKFLIFDSAGGILFLLLTIASLIIGPFFFWIYFKKFSQIRK